MLQHTYPGRLEWIMKEIMIRKINYSVNHLFWSNLFINIDCFLFIFCRVSYNYCCCCCWIMDCFEYFTQLTHTVYYISKLYIYRFYKNFSIYIFISIYLFNMNSYENECLWFLIYFLKTFFNDIFMLLTKNLNLIKDIFLIKLCFNLN